MSKRIANFVVPPDEEKGNAEERPFSNMAVSSTTSEGGQFGRPFLCTLESLHLLKKPRGFGGRATKITSLYRVDSVREESLVHGGILCLFLYLVSFQKF